MRDILKELNDRSPSDVKKLDEEELQRFEAMCECWAKIAEAERARRRALPCSQILPDVNCSAISGVPLVAH